MGNLKKIGCNYGHQRVVVFAERQRFNENKYKIRPEGNYCEGSEHLGIIVDAPCPLGAFGNDLINNNFILDYYTKRSLVNNNQLISKRLIDLFELTFIENNFSYALVIGPPESRDIIYPLIVGASVDYDFTAFNPENNNHLHTITIPLDFGSAFGKFYHEFEVLLN